MQNTRMPVPYGISITASSDRSGFPHALLVVIADRRGHYDHRASRSKWTCRPRPSLTCGSRWNSRCRMSAEVSKPRWRNQIGDVPVQVHPTSRAPECRSGYQRAVSGQRNPLQPWSIGLIGRWVVRRSRRAVSHLSLQARFSASRCLRAASAVSSSIAR